MAGHGPTPPPVLGTESLPLQTKCDGQRPRGDDHVPSGCLGGVSEHLSELAAAGAGTPRHLAEGWTAFAGMVHHRSSKWRTGDIGGFMGRRHAAHADEHYAEVRERRAHPQILLAGRTQHASTGKRTGSTTCKHFEPFCAFEFASVAPHHKRGCCNAEAGPSDALLIRCATPALTQGPPLHHSAAFHAEPG